MLPGVACVVGLQASNVPVTGLLYHRRPGPPKLSIKNNHVERGKVVTPPCRDAWQANRKAGLWRGGIERLEEAKATL